ncbi:type II toxin-antitoxin system RelE/ParE family toxin [Saccharopolyspora hattusasensis]|uniref:type II toxin-antitoxin system RelE/ParE family toxin n=1 Tax=Saccharopolyspora hattusasensis TaxID=1128679 RepID=UPI003D9795D4
MLGPDVQRAALRKLAILDAAETVEDLRVPPGNRLENLNGDRAGQYSIRINQQWASASSGRRLVPRTLRSWTTTEGNEDV